MHGEDLLGYFEIHSRTERALFHRDMVSQLYELAEREKPARLPEWVSVRYDVADPIVKEARVRLKLAKLQAEVDDARYVLIAGFAVEADRAVAARLSLSALVRGAYAHHEQHHEEIGAPRSRLNALEHDLNEALKALQWCAGAHDFQVGNLAADGYEKIVRPLVDRLRAQLRGAP